MSRSSDNTFMLTLTARQAEALRSLAALDDLPAEVYAAEVLAKHLYHAYTPEVARRAAGLGIQSTDAPTEERS